MGVVYKALDANLNRVVALKILKAAMAGNQSMLDRFRSEAQIQATLAHPNVATLHNFFLHEGSPVMVMECVDGETLQRMVERQGAIPAVEAVALFRQVLLGVEAAHKLGIIHRDIKPSNLMLNRSGVVKVMDFGVAKATDPDQTLTRSGVRVGTAYYMSPEQVKGEPVDIRTDIYALGITLYELLTAHVPFFGDSEFQILSDHVHRTPPPPSTYLPKLPKDLEAVVLKALEKDPAKRFQTVAEFCSALDRAALIPPTIVVTPGPIRWTSTTPAPRTPVVPQTVKFPLGKFAAVAGLIACVLTVVGFVRFKNTPPAVKAAQVTPAPLVTKDVRADDPPPALQTTTVQVQEPAANPASLAPPQEARPPAAKKTVSRSAASVQQPQAAATPALLNIVPAPVAEPAAPSPSASQAAIDEAAHRLARLRSRSDSLHANLQDLRSNLAAQGLSIRAEAAEAAANLDLYLAEAERALQAGDTASANTNMDRADYTARKLAGLTGG